MKSIDKYQQIIGKINYWLFVFTIFLLPFHRSILRYVYVAWIISWYLELRWVKRPGCLKNNIFAIPFILFGIWYLWKIGSILWITNYSAWASQIERYMTFGLIVPIALWGMNEHYEWRKIGKVFVLSCVVAMLVYPAIFTLFFYNREIVEFFNFNPRWNFTANTWYYYFTENISFLKHRLFLCSVELFGVVVAIRLYAKKLKILLPIVIIMLSSIPLTGSRQSILTCTGMIVVGIIIVLPKVYSFRYGVLIILFGFILGGGLLLLHPRMQKFNFANIVDISNVDNSHDARLNIWGLALQEPSDYFWTGLGAGQGTIYLIKKYEKLGLTYYAERKFHSHNQYLEELMDIGVFGMIFFIAAWLSIPICSHGYARKTSILFSTLFMMNMLTDCMFYKFCGIALWTYAMIFIYLQNQAEDNISIEDK